MPLSPPITPNRKVFLETLGCQMNVNDSEMMLGLLQQEGFESVSNQQDADLLIVNTCQIRASAEDKAFSHLGVWGKMKARKPGLKIAMAGCVSQQGKDTIFKRAPYIDIVFGTQNIHELPQLVRRAFEGEEHVLAVDKQKARSTYDYVSDVAPVRESDISAWITIIEGCDYFCTYCVVPYTRGRQISRPPTSILQEVLKLAEHGFKEITLLGQTVDSYGKDWKDNTRPEGTPSGYGLADLLRELNDITGLERIRFMTSHPLDLNDHLIEAIATLPKVMEYVHIPMQAGDTEVLRRMRRGYTAEQYYALVDKIYAHVPGVAVTGDYIVGFPGETDDQFAQTVASVKRSGIHNANTAAYSARNQTPAALWETRGEEVPEVVKQERLQILNAAIRDQSLAMNQPYAQQIVEVLVEGPSKRNPDRLMGRTRSNKVVNFTPSSGALARGMESIIGQLIHVRIDEALPFSFIGEMTDRAVTYPKPKVAVH
jgi:tRNA-2-methylthio-N6-dimethylallyladenosine synthase